METPLAGWDATDRRILLILGLATTLGLGTAFWRAAGRGLVEIDRLPESSAEYRLDVNQATWVEWAQLEGIGESLGRAIVADREANGPFRSVDDVARVKGVGPTKLAAMRPWLTVPEVDGP